MEENTGVLYTSSEQHKSSTKGRITRDNSSATELYNRLTQNSTFTNDTALRNIMYGITADISTNVDDFYTMGEN